MTFLNPAILFGLLAASLPILLHLINLKKLKRIEFSTLSFLKELQKTRIRKIKLKQLILLALRILIIVFLVMAFARPAVKSISFAGAASTAKTTAVIILDNTFSMSVVDRNGSYFNRAKQAAEKLIANFSEGDEISLILTGSIGQREIRPVTNFSALAKSIRESQISFVSGTINSALVKAAGILSASKNFNKEIYLLSDLQKDRLYKIKNEFSDLSKELDGSVRLFVIRFSGKDPVNLGITEFASDNQIFEKNKTVSFTASVKNYSSQTVSNSVVSLFINGKRSAQQSVNLSPGETGIVRFETGLTETGLVEAYAELEDDDIAEDNRRFADFYVPVSQSVLLLYDKQEDARFVRLALGEGAGGIDITEKYLSQISSLSPGRYDAVIIIGSENIADMNTVEKLARSSGVIIFPSSAGSLSSFQKLCGTLQIPAPVSDAGRINSPDQASSFNKIDYQNPVFSNLFEENVRPSIESPEIYRYFKISPGASGKNIISLVDGSAFLSEYSTGGRKALAFASSPALSWGTFPLKGFFAPLLHKCISYISSRTRQSAQYLAGEYITADISESAFPRIEIVKPDGANEFIATDSLINKNFLEYSGTNLTGTYRFNSGGELLDFAAVNCDPAESATASADAGEFEEYLKDINFQGKIFDISPDEDFNQLIYEARIGSELWRYFLIAALLLAIAESLVARNSRKEISDLTK